MSEKNIKEMSYTELEEESNQVLKKLNDSDLPLDEATKLFEYGISLSKEMETRLTELEKKVTDVIDRG